MTLFVNKATIANDRHGELTWGAAQAGVAAGVLAALHKDVIIHADVAHARAHRGGVGESRPPATRRRCYANNEAATLAALAAGRDDAPVGRRSPSVTPAASNPYFEP